MRKITLLSIFAFLVVLSAQSSYAQVFSEDFTGFADSSLVGQSGWTKGGSGPGITVDSSNPLTWPGYANGGGAYAVMGAPNKTTSRVYKTFPKPDTAYSGTTFYYSFLLRLNATSTTATNYFISLGSSGTTTSYGAKLFAKTSGTGYNIGISKTSNTASFGTRVLGLDTTYLIVVRYSFHAPGIDNKTDDECYLWVNPVLSSEPSTSAAECSVLPGATDTDMDGYSPAPSDIGNFLWHNRGLGNPSGAFDGIRIGHGTTSSDAWTNLSPAAAASGVKDGGKTVTGYSLSQNYPNPFNPTTVIGYSTAKGGNVSLKVYDLLGRELRTLVDGFQEPGAHSVSFDASNLPSGIYLYKISVNGFTTTNKMTVLR